MSKERFLSSLQYATGCLMLGLFSWGYILPLLGVNLPSFPLLLPSIMITFFTHATLGVRSTTLRYHLFKPWMDWAFFLIWLGANASFFLRYQIFWNSVKEFF